MYIMKLTYGHRGFCPVNFHLKIVRFNIKIGLVENRENPEETDDVKMYLRALKRTQSFIFFLRALISE